MRDGTRGQATGQDVGGELDAEELRLLVQKLARRIRSNRGDDSLSDSHLAVLFHLEREAPRSPASLAAAERVSPPSMNRTLNALEERGLVARSPADGDARRVDVALTDAGVALILETRQLRRRWFDERLAELSTAERAALAAALPVLRHLVHA